MSNRPRDVERLRSEAEKPAGELLALGGMSLCGRERLGGSAWPLEALLMAALASSEAALWRALLGE